MNMIMIGTFCNIQLCAEMLFVRATDKCGNVVELYFMQEFSNE